MQSIDDMIAEMISNKKLNSIVTELFIRGRKINISLAFIKQSYFKVRIFIIFQIKESFSKLQQIINQNLL